MIQCWRNSVAGRNTGKGNQGRSGEDEEKEEGRRCSQKSVKQCKVLHCVVRVTNGRKTSDAQADDAPYLQDEGMN